MYHYLDIFDSILLTSIEILTLKLLTKPLQNAVLFLHFYRVYTGARQRQCEKRRQATTHNR